jgi:hypothetical protein
MSFPYNANGCERCGRFTWGNCPITEPSLYKVPGMVPARLFRNLSRLRACGADDGQANRTPSAWMISPAIFFAQRQIVFFVWVTFGERKWSILAERRG